MFSKEIVCFVVTPAPRFEKACRHSAEQKHCIKTLLIAGIFLRRGYHWNIHASTGMEKTQSRVETTLMTLAYSALRP